MYGTIDVRKSFEVFFDQQEELEGERNRLDKVISW
jgi:hypothetical protein